MKITSRALAAAAAAAVLALVAPATPRPADAEGTQLSALVASNAKAAFEDLIKDFEAKHKGVTVKAEYLGGATIGKRIDGGEAVDVVLVGSTILDKEQQLIDPPTPVLQNKETILVPKGNPAKIKTLKDLANPGVKLSMGTPTSAVGKLASQVLQKASVDYGFDFITSVRKNIAVQSEKGSDVVDAIGPEGERRHHVRIGREPRQIRRHRDRRQVQRRVDLLHDRHEEREERRARQGLRRDGRGTAGARRPEEVPLHAAARQVGDGANDTMKTGAVRTAPVFRGDDAVSGRRRGGRSRRRTDSRRRTSSAATAARACSP